MKTHLLMTAAIVAAILLTSTARADECRAHLVDVNRLSGEVPVETADRRALRRLAEAALLLDAAAHPELCEDVVDEMRDLLEERAEGAREEARREDVLAAVAAAEPLAALEAPLDATAVLTGLEVVNEQGESLGTVERVVVEPNKGAVLYVVLERDGFLGLLDDEVAVPWGALRIGPERDIVVLPVSRARFEAAPELDGEDAAPDTSWLG